ncbi:DUF2812 domain-containing protein [Clostridiaceae bacterium M8S5]|nr:DUF2812 domain-containing protein [Clostridiaceae bacterium M8S5]
MIKYRFFIDTEKEAKFLNNMSSQGYRLTDTGSIKYTFEKCQKNKYIYAVDFVGGRGDKSFKDYTYLLSDLGIKYYAKKMNLGKYSYHNLKLRFFNRDRIGIDTTKGSLNSEFLILEKENDSKAFEVYTDNESKLTHYRAIRNIGFLYLVVILLSIMGSPELTIMGKDYTYMIEDFASKIKIPLIGVLSLLAIIPISQSIGIINKIKHIKENRYE